MNRYFPGAAAATIVAALTAPVAAPHAAAATYDITIDQITVDHSGTPKRSIAYTGQTPGPILRFKEGACRFDAGETAVTFGVMLVGGVLASGLAVWHALRTPPQLALGG